MPWIVKCNKLGHIDGIADITATFTNDNGEIISVYSSRIRLNTEGEIEKFVLLAKENLALDLESISVATNTENQIITLLNNS